MTKTTAAPPSDLVTQRKHVAALESERATLAARLRQASADGDAATVMQLTTRREMLPVLIADGRAALVPREVAAIEEELDAVAVRLAAHRGATGVLRGRETVHHRPSQLPPAHDRAAVPAPAPSRFASAGRRPGLIGGP